ncbi:MAG: winged helix-turn-helix domain-containing protein, partial [Mobilitalea sp.]
STDTGNSISDDFLNLPGLHINFKKYQVLLNGLEVELTAKEFDLLAFLTRNRGQVFTREQLLKKVWGFDYAGDTRAVDSAIKRLRKKINNEEKNHIFIHTVRGIGYRFEVPNQ